MSLGSTWGIVLGYSTVLAVILCGYLIRRSRAVPDSAERTLNRVAFYAATPSLYFVLLATSDLGIVFSPFTIASAVPMAVTVVLTVIVLLLVPGRLRVPETALLASSTVFANTGNIGIPIMLYAFGSADYVAPIILLQVMVMSPVLLVILDLTRGTSESVGRVLVKPFRNPIIIASIAGVIVGLLGVEVPRPILTPLDMLGDSSIPILLLAFGMSIRGARIRGLPRNRWAWVWVAVAMKAIVLPALTLIAGAFLFDMRGAQLVALVVISCLPSAQSIYNYATQYGMAVAETRFIVFATTALSVPVIVLVAVLLP